MNFKDYIICPICKRQVRYGACFGNICPECEADHLTGSDSGSHSGICGKEIYNIEV